MNKVLKMVVDASPLRTAHFIMIYFLGFKIAADSLGVYILNLKLFIGILATTLGWFFVVSINNYFDREYDRISNPHRGIPEGVYSERELLIFTLVSAVVGGSLSIILSIKSLFFFIFFILLGYLYSCPRVYLKKYGVKSIIIGVGSSLIFGVGYFSIQHADFTRYFWFLFFMIMVIFSAGSTINDLKDVEMDINAGVITPYTLFGRKGGKIVTIFLLLIAFMLPSLITPQGTYVFLVLSILAGASLWFEKVKFIYLLYFVEYLLLLHLL